MRRFCFVGRRDRGQTMIFFAILSSALLGTMGIAVEGGRVFVEYRHLQAAADMAAIVGAQKLPCSTTDTTCISNAESQGCTYASNNGFGSCTSGSTNAPFADVPPQACSPYDFMDFGNGSSDAHCKTATSPPFYDFIEVKLQDNLGTIPIFNLPVTLTAHAVAKGGTTSPGDWALMELDPNTQMSFNGSNTTDLVGSAFANGGISGKGPQDNACDGGWFSAGSVSNVSTDDNGTEVFAPASCSGSNNTTALTGTNLPQESDPYSGSSAPPTYPTAGSFPNCTECTSNGWYVNLDTGKWTQGGDISGGSNYELFPGIYGSFQLDNSDHAYFNPGVYTFTTGFDTNHGTMCVYGSPSCDNASCATTDFSAGTSAADQWEYSCSPYGFWDSSRSISGGDRPETLLTDAPTFYDASSGAASETPLNGVAIFIPSGAPGVTEHGNSGMNGNVYLAASDPCLGTGTYTAGSPPTVTFPSGSNTGVFTYSSPATYSGSAVPHGVSSSTAGVVYPSQDFSLLGECHNYLLDWPGEFANPQHLHFLWFIQGAQSITFNGASAQQWTGIVYGPQASITINGAGKGAQGPPWINGQLIGYDVYFTGNSYNDIAYRACGEDNTPCGSGIGSQLVE
jgi:hypothetical protein